MTPSLLHGMNGMENKDIEKLDLEYQYTMLARHVKDFLDEVVQYDTYEDGLYQVVDDDLEPMMKRLEVIKSLLRRGKEEVCKSFAESQSGQVLGMTMNYWPSSQICMDCEHGVFIMDDKEPASTYACRQGEELLLCSSECSMFEEKEKYSDE